MRIHETVRASGPLSLQSFIPPVPGAAIFLASGSPLQVVPVNSIPGNTHKVRIGCQGQGLVMVGLRRTSLRGFFFALHSHTAAI